MIRRTVETIGNYLSGQRARSVIQDLLGYHRIQASTGYREAARFCHRYLEGLGVDVELLSFPADDRTKYWTHHMFREWDCRGAYLELTGPERERLCDFHTVCNSVMARSGPADFRDRDVDIVWLDKGPEEEHYGGIDLAGKLIFVDSEHSAFSWAMERRGAVGVICQRLWDLNGFRDMGEMQTARQSMSFSWTGEERGREWCGFVLDALQGDKLRRMCRAMEEDFQAGRSSARYPTARFFVDASLFDGAIEDVVASIPGSTGEEVVIVAHLCHPKTSANDNASGVAGGIEAIHALHHLIEAGELPPPKRAIKLILMPEFTGTYAYLATREGEVGRMMAGINLDMIGSSQRGNGCCTTLTDLPHSAPSFVHDLACCVVDLVKEDASMVDRGDISLYNYQPTDYLPQSDHFIYSDPSIGVPMLMMLQWPDKFYHTSMDTLDKIDPAVLGRNALVAAAYAYTLANLSVGDLEPVLRKLRERLAAQVAERLRGARSGQATREQLLEEREHLKMVYTGKVHDARRFFAGEEGALVDGMAAREAARIEAFLDDTYEEFMEQFPPASEGPKAVGDKRMGLVPRRLVLGPVSPFNFFNRQDGEAKEKFRAMTAKHGDAYVACDYVLYWADGKNTAGEIVERMARETGIRNPVFVLDYLELLADTGVVALDGGEAQA